MNTWKGLNSVSDPLIQTLFRIRVDRSPFQFDNKQSNQIRVERKPFIAGGRGVWPHESDTHPRLWISYSFPFHDLLVKRFMSCCGVGGGGNLLLSGTSSSHRRQQVRRWFFSSLSRLFKHKVDRKTWDDSHVSPLPKAKKNYATVENNWPGYFDRQRLLQNVQNP